MKFEIGQQVSPHELVTNNYGADHANKIHSDDGAAKYGFAGALVPGVGLYAYLTRPAFELLGDDWLVRGTMSAKFLKPIYDGERIAAHASVIGVDPVELELALVNSAGVLCAVGKAGLPSSLPPIDPRDFPYCALPELLRLPTLASFRIGEPLGSLDFTLDLAGEGATFLTNVVETSLRYRTRCHPAFYIAKANEIVMANIALGPWIHTESQTRHYALAADGERLSLRGRVTDLQQRRGHEIIVADLALFGENNRVIAHIEHSAIIKLREPNG